MVNEIYRKLIENLYNHLHPNIQNIISNYGPERLYSLINPRLPYLDNFLHGASYVPYAVGSEAVASIALGIKEEDRDTWKIKELQQIGYGYVGLIGPFIEETLFRFIPSCIGKFIGGDMGEIAMLGLSSVLFAAGHGYKYKNKKFRGFISQLVSSLFFMHTYITGGFLSSFGLHSVTNTIGYVGLKYSKQPKTKHSKF